MFDSSKSETTETFITTYTDGTETREKRIPVTTQEQWGYRLTITNRSPKPLGGLRAEHLLFSATLQERGAAEMGALPINTIKPP